MYATGYVLPLLFSACRRRSRSHDNAIALVFCWRIHIHEGAVLLCLMNPFQQSQVIAVFAGLVWRSADNVSPSY